MSRTFAYAALAGGLCWTIVAVFALATPAAEEGSRLVLSDTSDYLAHGAFAAALAFTVVAILGLHLHQQGAGGRLGRVGALVAMAGCAAQSVVISTIVVTGEEPSWFGIAAPLAILTWLVGSVLLGIAIRGARVLPRWVGVALPIVTAFAIVGSEAGTSVLIGIFLVVIGARLTKAEAATRPAWA